LLHVYDSQLVRKDEPIVILAAANLSGADLSAADLSAADLRDAVLSGARRLTDKQLATATTLNGATMPDGSTHTGSSFYEKTSSRQLGE